MLHINISKALEDNPDLIFNQKENENLSLETQFRNFFSLNFQNQATLFFLQSPNANTGKLSSIVIMMAFNMASQRTLALMRYHLPVIPNNDEPDNELLILRPLTQNPSLNTTIKPEIIDWDNKIPGTSGIIISPALLARHFYKSATYEYDSYKTVQEIYEQMNLKQSLIDYIKQIPELICADIEPILDFVAQQFQTSLLDSEPLRKLDKEIFYNYLNSQVSESNEKSSVKSLKI